MTTPEDSTTPVAPETPTPSAELDAEALRKAKASERARKAAATRARNAAAKAADTDSAVAAAPEVDEPVAAESVAAEPVDVDAVDAEPVAVEPAAEPVTAEPVAEPAYVLSSAATEREVDRSELGELFSETAATDYAPAPVHERRASTKQRTLVIRVLVSVFTVILVPLGFSLIFQGGYPIYGMFAQGYETPPEMSSVLLILLGVITLAIPAIATAWSSLGMYIIGGILTVAGAIGIFSFAFFWQTYEVLAQAGVGEFVTVMTILTLSSGLGFAAGILAIAFGVATAIARRKGAAMAEAAPVRGACEDEFAADDEDVVAESTVQASRA